MNLTRWALRRWKRGSIRLAYKLGYDRRILKYIEKNVMVILEPGWPNKGNWYGWAIYGTEDRDGLENAKHHTEILVYKKNLSCLSREELIREFERSGVPKEYIQLLTKATKRIPQQALFEVINQSGMDHEIIGHCYHFLARKPHGEEVACNIQVQSANKRAGLLHPVWKLIARFVPIIMYMHKRDEIKLGL